MLRKVCFILICNCLSIFDYYFVVIIYYFFLCCATFYFSLEQYIGFVRRYLMDAFSRSSTMCSISYKMSCVICKLSLWYWSPPFLFLFCFMWWYSQKSNFCLLSVFVVLSTYLIDKCLGAELKKVLESLPNLLE